MDMLGLDIVPANDARCERSGVEVGNMRAITVVTEVDIPR